MLPNFTDKQIFYTQKQGSLLLSRYFSLTYFPNNYIEIMFKYYRFITIIVLFFGGLAFGQTISVMTYNLRYDNPNDGENRWDNRKEFILSQINYYDPDIIGTQEGLKHQLEWLDENLADFQYEGVGRDIGRSTGPGEHSAIFYNKNKFRLLKTNTFWLSEMPWKPSKGWDASLNRVCTSILFENVLTKQNFWVFNLHLDHKGIIAREKSVDLVIDMISKFNTDNYPSILMGDFNLTPQQSPIQKLTSVFNDTRAISISKPFGPYETYCGWDICVPPSNRIDYIFTSKNNIIVNKYAVLIDIFNQRYPSDHLPVLVNISLKN